MTGNFVCMKLNYVLSSFWKKMKTKVTHFYLLLRTLWPFTFVHLNGHKFLGGWKIRCLGITKKINGQTVQPFYSIFYSMKRVRGGLWLTG